MIFGKLSREGGWEAIQVKWGWGSKDSSGADTKCTAVTKGVRMGAMKE